MKRIAFSLLVLAAPFMASNALGAACDATGLAVSPDFSTYSIPSLTLFALDGSPASCDLTMPLHPVGIDRISKFAATYSGELTDGTGGRLTVDHNGVTDTTNLVGAPGGTFGELATGTVFARGHQLQSTFGVAVTSLNGGDEFDLDTADYVLQSSADLFDLSMARTGIVTHLNGTSDLLAGAGQPLDGGDGVSLIGGVGSLTLGVSGKTNLDNGFSLLGGAAYLNQTTAGAAADGAILSAGARYLTPQQGQAYRPFFEIGAVLAPNLGTTFGLAFTSPSRMTLASSSTSGAYIGGYFRGGVLVAPTLGDTIVLSATLAKDWLSVGALSEDSGDVNAFVVDEAGQTGSFDTGRIAGSWTHHLTPAIDLTLSGALGRTFAETPVTSTIASAGSFNTEGASENFAEYGLRATYEVTSTTKIGAFVFGTTGQYSGTHVQVGGDLHVSF